MTADTITILALAKVNLALHITQRRADGYHVIDSDVVFADHQAADRIAVCKAECDSFKITGPFATLLNAQDDNLVTRARDMVRGLAQKTCLSVSPIAITLDKQLPIASGIGGGSSDAAATIKALMQIWHLDQNKLDGFDAALLALGADVPMCFAGQPLRASGIGEDIAFHDTMPDLPAVLVNPMRSVSTPKVFNALQTPNNAPLPVVPNSATNSVTEFAQWLTTQTRNDLQAAAINVEPSIADVRDSLTQNQALLARMSGSGATCFGLYDGIDAARHAAQIIAKAQPEWWVRATMLSGTKQ